MNGVQTRFKCKLDVKRCKRFVFPPSSLLPRSNALKTKAIRYFQTDQTLTRIVSSPLDTGSAAWNKQLSEDRANNVANELVKLGVNKNNLIISGMGGVNTLTPPAFNRRVIIEAQ